MQSSPGFAWYTFTNAPLGQPLDLETSCMARFLEQECLKTQQSMEISNLLP